MVSLFRRKDKDEDEDKERLILELCADMPVPTWVPRDEAKACRHCEAALKSGHAHNCVLCGEVFCSHCTGKYHVPEKFNLKKKPGPRRVCISCRDWCLQRKVKSSGSAGGRIENITGLNEDGKEIVIYLPKWDEINAYDECKKCRKKMSHKYHCRLCGRMFCGNCTEKREVPEAFKRFKPKPGPARVCDYCRYLVVKGAKLVEQEPPGAKSTPSAEGKKERRKEEREESEDDRASVTSSSADSTSSKLREAHLSASSGDFSSLRPSSVGSDSSLPSSPSPLRDSSSKRDFAVLRQAAEEEEKEADKKGKQKEKEKEQAEQQQQQQGEQLSFDVTQNGSVVLTLMLEDDTLTLRDIAKSILGLCPSLTKHDLAFSVNGEEVSRSQWKHIDVKAMKMTVELTAPENAAELFAPKKKKKKKTMKGTNKEKEKEKEKREKEEKGSKEEGQAEKEAQKKEDGKESESGKQREEQSKQAKEEKQEEARGRQGSSPALPPAPEPKADLKDNDLTLPPPPKPKLDLASDTDLELPPPPARPSSSSSAASGESTSKPAGSQDKGKDKAKAKEEEKPKEAEQKRQDEREKAKAPADEAADKKDSKARSPSAPAKQETQQQQQESQQQKDRGARPVTTGSVVAARAAFLLAAQGSSSAKPPVVGAPTPLAAKAAAPKRPAEKEGEKERKDKDKEPPASPSVPSRSAAFGAAAKKEESSSTAAAGKTEGKDKEKEKEKSKEAERKERAEKPTPPTSSAEPGKRLLPPASPSEGPKKPGPCLECGCNNFQPRPFKPHMCQGCFHDHTAEPGSGAPLSPIPTTVTQKGTLKLPSTAKSPTSGATGASGGKCADCGCEAFKPHPFKKGVCGKCLHIH